VVSALRASLGLSAASSRWANTKEIGIHGPPGWRALLMSALLALGLVTALAATLREARHVRAPAALVPSARADRAAQEGFSSFPLSLQAPVSRALGAGGGAYRIAPANGGFAAVSPAQHLSLRFGRAGVSIHAGATQVGLRLRAAGSGSALDPIGQAAPLARANRVSYRRGSLAEWYVNGPLGLEQGFTIPRPLSRASTGPLTLSLTLSGNADASLAAGGHSIALSHNGGPSLRYSGLSAADATGRVLRSRLELHGPELLLRVDARGARYPLRIDPFVQQKGKLTGGGERGEGKFGVSVALSSDGNTALIGAPDNQAPPIEREGEVTEKSKVVKNLSSTTGIFPGTAVSGTKIPEGDTVAKLISTKEVELFEAVEGEGTTKLKEKLKFVSSGIGAAWVFTRSGSTWGQQAKLAEPTEEIGQARFGQSVALSPDGNTALVGGPGNSTGAGAAWVFTRSGSTWTQQAKLTGGKEEVTSEAHPGGFGSGVALGGGVTGNTALIGGPGDKEELGAAWVFTRSGTTWTQQGLKLTGASETGAGRFGYSVALGGPEGPEGTTALVGAPEDKSAEGAAWIFRRNSEGKWLNQTEPKLAAIVQSGTPGQFGLSVALESLAGNTALIGGASNRRIAAEPEAEVTEKSPFVKGLTSTKSISPGFEVKGGKVKPFTTVRQVKSETEVELSEPIEGTGTTTSKEILTFAERNAGAAWVFTRSSEKWTQQAKLTATGEIGEGQFGEGLALTSNGSTALIGAPGNNGNAGTAWVYTRSGSTWTQGQQVAPTDEQGKAQFGVSTALSSTGETALVGGFDDSLGVGAAWAFTTGPTPTVVTGSAPSVSQTTATLSGTVNPNGAEVTDCKFEYGPTTSYGSSAPCTSPPGSGTSPVPVSATVAGLVVDTTYHFRISATDSGTSTGSDQTFATLPNPPTVETEGTSNVTTNSATLHGSVNPNATGNPAPLECKLEWGPTTAYGSSAPCKPTPSAEGTQPVRVTAQATGLLPNAVYHFRIFAKNAGGESPGSDFAFTTVGVAPTVITEAASSVTQTSASVSASVNPNGGSVSECKFEYGPTEAYGASAPCTAPPGSGRNAVPVSAALESLAEATTYHFRISATNPFGTSVGSDQTFTTTLVLGPHWYQNHVLLTESALENGVPTMAWGSLTLENTKLGAFTCQTLIGGSLANPTGGGAGKGFFEAVTFYDCTEPVCEGAKGLLQVTPEKLKWSSVLIEEAGTFRDRIEGIAVREVCVGGAGNVEFHGKLAPQLEAGTTIGAAPARLAFGAGAATLQSTEGAGTVVARLKLMGFEGGEIISAKKT
jgi:hypothetical protein